MNHDTDCLKFAKGDKVVYQSGLHKKRREALVLDRIEPSLSKSGVSYTIQLGDSNEQIMCDALKLRAATAATERRS